VRVAVELVELVPLGVAGEQAGPGGPRAQKAGEQARPGGLLAGVAAGQQSGSVPRGSLAQGRC
jgi:hypothetical protein